MKLRNRYDVTVIDMGLKPAPLQDEVRCDAGAVNTTINRGRGLGGTTEYWHNALIELDPRDLAACGLDTEEMARWYPEAWHLFLSEPDQEKARAVQRGNREVIPTFDGSMADMVVRQQRANMWQLAGSLYPGDPVAVRQATVIRIGEEHGRPLVAVRLPDGTEEHIRTDRCVIAAGGIGTPLLLARSFGLLDQPVGGYHDHPMTYVAKIRVRQGSWLPQVSCVDTSTMSIRTGFCYEVDGVKSAFYLRPAISMNTRSITGGARYILSDLRNDPFSPRKIMQLLSNPEAIREGLLFKSRAGFMGEYYSLLMLGEQTPLTDRGVTAHADGSASLDWRVTPAEHRAYQKGLDRFLADFSAEIVATNRVDAGAWDYRTAAHHSGGAARFLDAARGDQSVAGLPGVHVCDGSVLRAGGIANSGLTLTALALRLADLVKDSS